MISDDDDIFGYIPLQRSQVSARDVKPKLKASKLSISGSQITEKVRKATQIKQKTTSAKVKTTNATPTKIKRSPSKKITPVKSRADRPEENCNDFELAKWKFLYRSPVGKPSEARQPVKRKSVSGESSSNSLISTKQKKNVVETSDYQSTSVKCNGLKTTSLSHSSGRNFLRHNGTDKWSLTSVSSPKAGQSSEVPDVIMLTDDENVPIANDFNSIALFDMKESNDDKSQVDKKSINSRGSLSSDLLEPLVDLFEDQTTVYFPSAKGSPSKVVKKQRNHKPLASSIPGDINGRSGSTTPDILNNEAIPDISNNEATPDVSNNEAIPDISNNEATPDVSNNEAEAAEWQDSGDEIIANAAQEAIDHFAMPVIEKVMSWKRNCEKAQTKAAKPSDDRSKPALSRSHETIIQPLNIHFHFHEASPASSTSKESGQRSILSYFKRTTNDEKGPPDKPKTYSMKENIAAWQGVMDAMRKRSLVSLPSVSPSTITESTQNSQRRPSRPAYGSANTNSKWRRKDAGQSKPCPFYKYIPETSFVVDAFNYGIVEGVTAYFLTHFHYDHYIGLKKTFDQPIYCSEITARLVKQKLGVPLQYLHALPMWEPLQVCGVEVTLLNANHCPGAVMFLFKVRSGRTHLHVGDFRAHPSMESYPALQCPINTLFLDTTYCSPDHVFPTQEKMVEKCVSLAQDHHQRNSKTLFVVGSYTIGKEKVFQAIASSLDCSIWVRSYKKQILKCIDDREIQSRLHNCKTSAKVHVLPMKEVQGEKLLDYLNQLRPSFEEIVGICPTGWEFTGGSSAGDPHGISRQHPYPDVYIYGIPYSEHSSFNELRRFVKFIKAEKIVPTVNNGNPATRKQMHRYFMEWQRSSKFS